MKLFRLCHKENIIFLSILASSLLLGSCATKSSQYGSKFSAKINEDYNPKNISHTFYLIGDAGNLDRNTSKKKLSFFEERLKKADTNSTAIFLGDNIYPKGMPLKSAPDRKQAEEKLNNQLVINKNFKGKTVFIPGNHDWYNGLEGLREQEKIVTQYLKKRAFLPEKSCGIDHVNINETTALIVINSQWYFEDWDKHATINDDCDIKTREDFFKALENKLNDFQNKTVIIALHHPLMTNGLHGGEFSLKKQLFPLESKIPLPVIGSLINLVRKTSGIIPQDIQNKEYNAFVKRIKTLIQDKSNIVVVSGHDHNLQYIDKDNIKQIISGAGSKEEAARAINKNDFSYGHNGYAVLQVLKNGASKVSYYGVDYKGKETLLFEQKPTSPKPKPNLREYPNTFSSYKDTTVYTKEMTRKSGIYKFLWGNHYRKVYSTTIRAKMVRLDTLYGGLKPTKSGGGPQERSLYLEDNSGREYVMRALHKSATRFLQLVAFKDQSVERDFRNTYAENFILDFYTTSHPYTPLVVDDLAQKLQINHSNPKLFFVPKQNVMGLFNENFGNELYLVEEVPMNDFKNLASFDKPKNIVTTEEVLTNIQKEEKYEIDEAAYIKARLFDMLIGDWHRDSDQWRWGEYKEKNKIIYRPIPMGRDQAFTKYDGNLLKILVNMPPLRHMKTFDDDLKNVKWFNRQAHALDLALIKRATLKDWLAQAKFIEDNLSNAEIDKAFQNIPKEVNTATIGKIKSDLKIRKTHLEKYARQYFKVLQKTTLVVGTEKKDKFLITRNGNETNIKIYRVKEDGEELFHERTYRYPETKELWVYGIGDDDIFEVNGEGRKKIRLRLMGGINNDSYTINSGKKVSIYDFKTAENTINNNDKARVILSENYDINTYNYQKPKYNFFSGHPLIGFNPDDGIKIGGVAKYTVNGFKGFPYSQKHIGTANYYFATGGYELSYKGLFPHFIGKWNLIVDAQYTSPNFSINFFGFGNETKNDKDKDRDYNRVKIRTFQVSPSIQWVGEEGSELVLKASGQRIEVDPTPDRFIAQPGVINQDVFDHKTFLDVNARYTFENYDNVSNPTLGMTFSVLGGYTVNTRETKKQFPYAESTLGFTLKVTNNEKLVLATRVKGKALFNNDYEFYQAATVGGDFDLRGFRNQRFSGKQSLYHSSDLRFNLGKLKNTIAPVRYGVFGGFDYGRVWTDNDNSEKWHQSYGGGLWINGINIITGQISVFNSTDGLRVAVGVGFGL